MSFPIVEKRCKFYNLCLEREKEQDQITLFVDVTPLLNNFFI